jgi:hypothetical protein
MAPLCKVGLALLASSFQVPGLFDGAMDLIWEHCF